MGGGGDQIPRIFDSSPEKMLQNQIELCNIHFFGVFFFELNVRERYPGQVSGNMFFFLGKVHPEKKHSNQDPPPKMIKNGRSFLLFQQISGHFQVPTVRKFGGKTVILGPPVAAQVVSTGPCTMEVQVPDSLRIISSIH